MKRTLVFREAQTKNTARASIQGKSAGKPPQCFEPHQNIHSTRQYTPSSKRWNCVCFNACETAKVPWCFPGFTILPVVLVNYCMDRETPKSRGWPLAILGRLQSYGCFLSDHLQQGQKIHGKNTVYSLNRTPPKPHRCPFYQFFDIQLSMAFSPPSLGQQVLHSGLHGASTREHSGEDGAKRRAAKLAKRHPLPSRYLHNINIITITPFVEYEYTSTANA